MALRCLLARRWQSHTWTHVRRTLRKKGRKKLHAYVRTAAASACICTPAPVRVLNHASEGKMDIFSVWSHMLELQTVENKQNDARV